MNRRRVPIEITPQSRLWVIIDIHEWDQPLHPRLCVLRLPPEKRPSLIYQHREDAEAELARLTRLYPAGEFFLFETVAVGTCLQTCAGAVGRVDLLS